MERYKSANLGTIQTQANRGAIAASQIAASGFESLTSKLESFNSMAYKQMAVDAKAQAVKDATSDLLKRKKQASDIMQDEKLTPKQKDEKIAEIASSGAEKDNTIYGVAYNNAFSSAFANQVQIDAKMAANQAVIEANGDSEIYGKTFQKYAQHIVKSAPTPELAVVAQNAYNKYSSETYKNLKLAEIKEQTAINKKNYESATKIMEEDYIKAYADGDKVEQQRIITNYMSASQNAINQKWTSQNEILSNIRSIEKKAFNEKSLNDFRNSKDRATFLDAFRDNDLLTFEETEATITKMHSLMRSEIQDKKIAEDRENEEIEQLKIDTKKDLNIKLISGELNDGELTEALSNGVITLSEYDNLLERSKTTGVSVSDSEEYNRVFVDLDMASESDIINNAKLSNEDKLKLIQEKSRVDNWQSSRDGKQALTEIRNHFGFLEGTFTAKLDFDNQLTKDYGYLQTLLYNKVEQNIMNQKPHNALEISRQIMADYKTGKIVGTKPQLDLSSKEDKKEDAEPKEETIKGENKAKDAIKFLQGIL